MAIFTKDGNTFYTYSNATNLLDESGFTKVLVNLLIKCSRLKSLESFWRLHENAGFIGFNTDDTIIIRTYFNLGTYSIQDTVTIGNYDPYPMVLNEPADLLIEYDKPTRNVKISFDNNKFTDMSPLGYLTGLTLVFENADNIIDYDDFKESPLMRVDNIYDRYTDDKATSIIEESGFAPILLWLLETAKDLEDTQIWYFMNQTKAVSMSNHEDGIGIYIYYQIINTDITDGWAVTNAECAPEIFLERPQIYIGYNKATGKIEIDQRKGSTDAVDRLHSLGDAMYNANVKIFKWNN